MGSLASMVMPLLAKEREPKGYIGSTPITSATQSVTLGKPKR